MRNLLITAVIAFAMSACTKSGSTNTTPVNTLNATETSLLGTWYLQKTILTGAPIQYAGTSYGDTTFTGFTQSAFITFTSTSLSTKLEFNGTWYPNFSYPSLAYGSATITTSVWYYDQSGFLDIGSVQSTIISQSGNNLIIAANPATGGTITSYLSK